jgi:hypothetical protein
VNPSHLQAATGSAEFMTSALARRCAGISQLRHAGLPWSALSPTSEAPDGSVAGSEARSSGDRRSVSFSDASSNRSSQKASLSSRAC